MVFVRREFIKLGALGLAGTCMSSCCKKPELRIRLRGLCLLERFDRRLIVHAVDGEKVGISRHNLVLKVPLNVINRRRTTAKADDGEEVGRSTDFWAWNLGGKQVSIFNPNSVESLKYDCSKANLPMPGPNDSWSSTDLVPNLKTLSGAHKKIGKDAYSCQIVLNRGFIQSDVPKSGMGKKVIWTFTNPTTEKCVAHQAVSDTVLYSCPLLEGEEPYIRIDSDRVALNCEPSDFVTIENMEDHKEDYKKCCDPYSLGHFHVFYDLVDSGFVPNATADPPSPVGCVEQPKCDMEPIYCPPALI